LLSTPLDQGQESPLGLLINLLFLGLFFVMMFYGQRLQLSIMLREVEYALSRLRIMKDKAREVAIENVKRVGKPKDDPAPYVDRYMEYVFIQPTSLDPAGIVGKYDHLINVLENRVKEEVRAIAPGATEVQQRNLTNLLEVSQALNTIYRVIRHYYIFGKKTASYFIIIQIQAILPLIMREAEALLGALHAFTHGHPVGDGAGELVAGRFMHGHPVEEVAKETVYSELEFEGRKLIVIKSQGPGGTIGWPGDGLVNILKWKRDVKMVIMVDAGVKLEGEKSGEIFEGIGAAIGGIGTEKFKIEEICAKRGIPLYGLIVKMSIHEAISPVTKEIADGAEKAVERVKEIIREKTGVGDSVVILGVGNSIGVGQ